MTQICRCRACLSVADLILLIFNLYVVLCVSEALQANFLAHRQELPTITDVSKRRKEQEVAVASLYLIPCCSWGGWPGQMWVQRLQLISICRRPLQGFSDCSCAGCLRLGSSSVLCIYDVGALGAFCKRSKAACEQ